MRWNLGAVLLLEMQQGGRHESPQVLRTKVQLLGDAVWEADGTSAPADDAGQIVLLRDQGLGAAADRPVKSLPSASIDSRRVIA